MSISILLVEDEQDIRLMLQDRLISLGFDVTTANNGAEGIEVLEKTTVDGILLDIQMPVMDGITMLQQVREPYPRLPVIVMSAEHNIKRMIQAIERGAQGLSTETHRRRPPCQKM